VVSGSSEIIPNTEYVTMASKGEVAIEDPGKALEELADAGVGPYILGMSPFAQAAATDYRDAKREFAIHVFDLVTSIAVLLITALAVSVIYCRRNAQRLFVKYIHGWGFIGTHWRVLTIELALGMSLVLWVWHRTATVINKYDVPGAPPMPPGDFVVGRWEPAMAAGVAIASFALVIVTLARANIRIVKAHAASLT
jgi:hypothetical protein